MATEKQLAANRANAQLSTGPTSPEAKAKVSHNAVKTGLTGRIVLLPSEDAAAYQAHIERVFQQFAPETDPEDEPATFSAAKTQILRLTQSLADTLWRLERIPSLEAGIYAIGRRELAAQFADESDETVRRAMLDAQVLLTYRRDLNNLSIQECRLRRQYEKDEAEIKRLVAERAAAVDEREKAEKNLWHNAIRNYETAQEFDEPFDPAEIGFEFSTAQIVNRLYQRKRQQAIDGGRYYAYKSKGLLKRDEEEEEAA